MDEQPKRKRGRPRKTEVEKLLPKQKRNSERLKVLSDINDGMRDERGVRIQGVYNRRGAVAEPMGGEELLATYNLAKRNMERGMNGQLKPYFATVEEFQKAIIEYWEYLEKANRAGTPLIPDVEGLATFLGISRRTLDAWARSADKPGFPEVIEQVKNDIAACKKQLGQHGMIPPIVMAMDFNNNHGYTQQQKVVIEPSASPLGERRGTAELAAKYGKYMDVIDVDPVDVIDVTEDNEE